MKSAIYFSKQKLTSDFNYSTNNNSVQHWGLPLYKHKTESRVIKMSILAFLLNDGI